MTVIKIKKKPSAINCTEPVPVFKKARDVMKAPKKPKPCPFESQDDYKAFAKQYPREAAFFGRLVVIWRGSKAKHPAADGYWAAYPYAEWAAQMKVHRNTIGRWLNRLEDHGLIERERGKWGGNAVYAFFRPTPEGLQFAGGRPNDKFHLGKKPLAHKLSEPEPKPIAKAKTPEDEPKLATSIYDEKPLTLAELNAILDAPD